MIINYSDIFGFIGAFFLIIRLIPLLREQIYEPSELNISFLTIEYLACIFLGISAILIKSIPFIIANTICFINLSILLLIQFKIRNTQPNKLPNNDILHDNNDIDIETKI